MLPLIRQIIILLLIPLAPTAFYGMLGKSVFQKTPAHSSREISEITLTEVKSLKDPILWVDARHPSIYQKDHIPGAVCLFPGEWDSLIQPLMEQWKPGTLIVIYCDSDRCRTSHAVALRLQDMGMEKVKVLKGGWEAWKKEH